MDWFGSVKTLEKNPDPDPKHWKKSDPEKTRIWNAECKRNFYWIGLELDLEPSRELLVRQVFFYSMVPFWGTNLEFKQSLTRLDQPQVLSLLKPESYAKCRFSTVKEALMRFEQNDFKILKIIYIYIFRLNSFRSVIFWGYIIMHSPWLSYVLVSYIAEIWKLNLCRQGLKIAEVWLWLAYNITFLSLFPLCCSLYK